MQLWDKQSGTVFTTEYTEAGLESVSFKSSQVQSVPLSLAHASSHEIEAQGQHFHLFDQRSAKNQVGAPPPTPNQELEI